MKLEIEANDDIFDMLLVLTLKDQLKSAQIAHDNAKDGKLAGCYSWDDIEFEKRELKKDIQAYKRILMLYGACDE